MIEDNRARALRWMDDNWNKRRDAVVEELMHPACSGRMEGGGEVRGHEGWRQAREQLLAAFPDLSMKVDEAVMEGDTVVLLWSVQGTHASGRTINPVGSTWMKFKDGKMVWACDTWNQGAMMAALQP